VRKLPYDAIQDFTAIAMVGGTRNVLVVHLSALSRFVISPAASRPDDAVRTPSKP